MIKRLFLIWIIMLTCLSYPGFSSASTPIEITVQPDQVFIGATYNGIDISVSGQVPAETEAVIRVTGHEEDSSLKKKGRVMGLLWMNLGSVEFHNIPGAFLLYKSKQTDVRKIREIGIEAVRKKTDIISEYEDKDALFEEFVKMKQKSGLYETVENGIRYEKENNGMKPFTATVRLPSALPKGDYKLEVFALSGEDIAGYSKKELQVKQTGMPAFIAALAFDHGTLYGILAVIVALIAGLLTGTIFKGEKGAH